MDNQNPVASYDLKPLAKNKEIIMVGRLSAIPLKLLIGSELNRTKETNHVKLMESKIRGHGLLDTMKVFDNTSLKGEYEGMYQSAEGAHRINALKNIFGTNSNVLIPCMILPEIYNIDNDDQTLETIVLLNKDNKPWGLEDYIKSWAKTGRKDYKDLFNLIEKYGKPPTDRNLSVSQISYIYMGGRTKDGVSNLKTGKLTMSQEYDSFNNLFLETLSDWSKEWGTKKDMLHKTFSTFLFNKIAKMTTNQLKVVENKRDLYDWIEKLLVQFHKILNGLFESNTNLPRADRKKLPGLHDKMLEYFEHNFKSWVKNNPVPKPKNVLKPKNIKKLSGLDKFTATTRKTRAVA